MSEGKKSKFIPKVEGSLRGRSIKLPEAIYKASGIMVFDMRIKSLIFTTDVAIIKNSNANSVMAVYPFTPQLSITQAILEVANVPVFVGVGGGLTAGVRAINIALQAELMGAYGVVVNAPMKPENIKEIYSVIDIPIIQTVVSIHDEIEKKIEAGVKILNISGGADTISLVKNARNRLGSEFPIIATGGPTEESILATIDAGANAITYTPPTSAEIFGKVMQDYRNNQNDKHGG